MCDLYAGIWIEDVPMEMKKLKLIIRMYVCSGRDGEIVRSLEISKKNLRRIVC